VAPGLLAIPAPGHTPGHLILSFRGVAFVGDAVLIRNGRLRQLPGPLISDKKDALATADLIASLHPRLVCPGHGSPDRLAEA
jgi:glyoxylase-like metal-dependent hydrolase (beta-lactamase superfamily II)